MLFPTLSFGLFFLFVYVVTWAVSRVERMAQDHPAARELGVLRRLGLAFRRALLIASAFLNWGSARIIYAADWDPRYPEGGGDRSG
jgi:alginate O-acetyltransferase complex protein AlgI